MRLFSSLNLAEIRLMQSVLQSENIECFIRNEKISIAIGVVPVAECMPELWLVNPGDELRAQQILGGWKQQNPEWTEWICPNCGEENGAQFGECWNCETPAPD